MADRAAHSTDRAVRSLPTVNARAMLAAFDALGLDAAAIRTEADIAHEALQDSDHELAIEKYAALWLSAQARWQRPNLGAHTGANVPNGAYQLLDYLVASCGTVGEGFSRLARYTRIVSTALELSVVERTAGDAPIQIRLELPEPRAPVLAEFATALIVTRFRQLGAPSDGLRAIEFRHEGVEDPIFGCPVRFGALRDAILLSPTAWTAPLPRGDAKLLATLERHARPLLGDRGEETVAARVRAAIVACIDAGDVRISVVARRLGMSGRKLQSALQLEGASFQRLLDEERSALAVEYLKDTGLSIAEVAYLLGYSEPSAFTRAFTRWAGQSPTELRARR